MLLGGGGQSAAGAGHAAPFASSAAVGKVTASLLLSNARTACNAELLAREGVTFCVNVTRQQPFPGLQQARGMRVPVFDDPAEDLYRYFEQCSDAIEEAVQSGGKCLVYCKNGRSRSAAICTAYLMRHRNLPLKDAFEVLCPHPQWFSDGFWALYAVLRVDIGVKNGQASARGGGGVTGTHHAGVKHW